MNLKIVTEYTTVGDYGYFVCLRKDGIWSEWAKYCFTVTRTEIWWFMKKSDTRTPSFVAITILFLAIICSSESKSRSNDSCAIYINGTEGIFSSTAIRRELKNFEYFAQSIFKNKPISMICNDVNYEYTLNSHYYEGGSIDRKMLRKTEFSEFIDLRRDAIPRLISKETEQYFYFCEKISYGLKSSDQVCVNKIGYFLLKVFSPRRGKISCYFAFQIANARRNINYTIIPNHSCFEIRSEYSLREFLNLYLSITQLISPPRWQ